MNYENYELLLKAADGSEYSFVSKGPNGEIEIVVRFTPTRDPAIVNLCFGNLLPNGQIDDEARNHNLDRNKILATVARAVNIFINSYPEKVVLIFGSTAARTRLCHMAISANWEELSSTFLIYGIQLESNTLCFEEFNKNLPYRGFAVERKSLNS